MNRKLVIGLGIAATVAVVLFIIVLVVASGATGATGASWPPATCDYSKLVYGNPFNADLSELSKANYDDQCVTSSANDGCRLYKAGIPYEDAIKLHVVNGIWYYGDKPTGIVYGRAECGHSNTLEPCIDGSCFNCANDCGITNVVGTWQSQYNQISKLLGYTPLAQ